MRIDLPHELGKDVAKARLAANAHKLADHIPGKVADVQTSWTGDVMRIAVSAMGQSVVALATVEDKIVRAEIELPFLLGMFESPIKAALEREGPKLLK